MGDIPLAMRKSDEGPVDVDGLLGVALWAARGIEISCNRMSKSEYNNE